MIRLITSLLLCFFSLAVAAQRELPAELKPFVLKGFEWLDFAKEDMNADGQPDYILILKKEGEDTISMDNPDRDSPRPLLLIMAMPGGELKLWVRNDRIVLCRFCGGMMGDPYDDGLTTRPGEFSISFYGGSNWRWTEGYSFKHDKLKKNWFLEEHSSSSFRASEPEKEETSSTVKRKETGDITLEAFTPEYNIDHREWKVTAAKTWFYQNPDSQSRPGKAFLLKGDVVKGIRTHKRFVECYYTNKKGVTTQGYLLKAHLQPGKSKPDN